MRRLGALAAVSILLNVCVAAAQTLPELFQKAKAQVKGESWQNALKTLSLLEAEASKPGNDARPRASWPACFRTSRA